LESSSIALCSFALLLDVERALVVRPALVDVLVCSRMRDFSLGVQRAHLRLRGEIECNAMAELCESGNSQNSPGKLAAGDRICSLGALLFFERR
jgi:hypothetical protein